MNRRQTAACLAWAAALAGVSAGCEGEDVSQILGYDDPPLRARTDDDAGASRCVPGQTLACMGVCGQPVGGYQVCAADGRSYGECVCPTPERLDPAVPEGGGSGMGAMGTGEERPVNLPIFPGRPSRDVDSSGAASIGGRCQQDADCGGDLLCFDGQSDSLPAGGPAGGYCTKSCTQTADCAAADPLSACGTLAGQEGLCLRLCQSQAPPEGSSKCLDRDDLTCASLVALGSIEPSGEPELGICVPQCQSDAGCSGRRCDLASGLCTDAPASGDPLGSGCAVSEDCASGVCLTPGAGVGSFCSAFCTLGVPGCGFDGSEESAGASCLLPQVPGDGAGDRGLCFERCDLDEDCADPGATCVPDPDGVGDGVCLLGLLPDDVRVGNACERDDDCGAGLACLTPDTDPFGIGGGPAGGYCSNPCSGADDCSPGSSCVSGPAASFCMQSCDVDDATGCGGRPVLACVDLGEIGACLPDCQVDDDCGELACDVATGLCVTPPLGCQSDEDCAEGSCDLASGDCVIEPPGCTGDGDCEGGICDLDTGDCLPPEPGACDSDDDCLPGSCDLDTGDCLPPVRTVCERDVDCSEGVCEQIVGTCIDAPAIPIGGACTEDADCSEDTCLELAESSFCSGVCLLNTPLGCESYGSDAFCLAPLDGDLGLCIELCNTPEDCEQDGYECLDLGGLLNGRTGFCLPPEPPAP